MTFTQFKIKRQKCAPHVEPDTFEDELHQEVPDAKEAEGGNEDDLNKLIKEASESVPAYFGSCLEGLTVMCLERAHVRIYLSVLIHFGE